MNTFLRLSLAALLSTGLAGGASAQEERTVKFGHLNNADHPVSLGVKRFAEILARKSNGKLVVKEYPASTLGNEMPVASSCLMTSGYVAVPRAGRRRNVTAHTMKRPASSRLKRLFR